MISRLAGLTYTVEWTPPSDCLHDQYMFDSSRAYSIYTYDSDCIIFPLISGKLVAINGKLICLQDCTNQQSLIHKTVGQWILTVPRFNLTSVPSHILRYDKLLCSQEAGTYCNENLQHFPFSLPGTHLVINNDTS